MAVQELTVVFETPISVVDNRDEVLITETKLMAMVNKTNEIINGYVEKETGKGLSTNDLTDPILADINNNKERMKYGGDFDFSSAPPAVIATGDTFIDSSTGAEKMRIYTSASTYDYINILTDSEKAAVSSVGSYVAAGVTGSCPGPIDNLDGTFDMPSCNARLFSTSDWTGTLTQYVIPAASGFAPTDGIGTTSYLVVNYNSGSPIYQLTTDVNIINESDIIPVLTINRQGNSLNFLDWDSLADGGVNRTNARFVKTTRFEAQNAWGLSETGTRNITVDANSIWYGYHNIPLAAFNSTTDEFDQFYHVAGVWTKASITQYNNTQYDDGTDLQTASNNKFLVNWLYRVVENNPHMDLLLGETEYNSVAEAEAAGERSDKATYFNTHTELIGKIIVQEGSNTADKIIIYGREGTTSSSPTDHNDLAGKQGGTTDEYYHMTSLEYTGLQELVTTSVTTLHKHYLLTQPDGTNPFVYTDNSGTLHIDGDIVQNGSSYETHVEQVYTKKDLIITRDGAVAGLGPGEYTGIQATLYDGVNNGQLIFDNTGVARVGDVGSLVAIAGREDTPTSDGVAYWDSASQTFKTDRSVYIDSNGYFGVGRVPTSMFDVVTTDTIATSARFVTSDFNFGTVGSALSIQMTSTTGNATAVIQAADVGGTNVADIALNPAGGKIAIGTTFADTELTIVHQNIGTGGLTLKTATADLNNKASRIKNAHYDNSEEPMTLVYGTSTSSTGIINIGGGSGSENAATQINMWVASNNTTTTGVNRFRLTETGLIVGQVGGSSNAQAHLDINTEDAETCKVRINGEASQKARLEMRKFSYSEASIDKNMFYTETQSGGKLSIGSTDGSEVDTDIITAVDDGSVGIGAASPSQRFQSSTDSGVYAVFNGSTPTGASAYFTAANKSFGTYIGSLVDGTGLIQQRNASSENYYDLRINPYGGNVGIGMTANAKLEVSGGIIVGSEVLGSQPSTGSFSYVGGGEARLSGNSFSAGSGFLTFYTGGGGTTLGSEAVRIDASGNVGIAKNPSSGYKLDVNGVVRVSGTTASNARIQTVSTNTNETASIDFAVTTSDSTVTAQIEALRTNVATAADTDLLFKVFRNSTLTERMRILSDGHITYDGCFAGIHVHDASTAQSIANGATYVKLTAFTDNDGSSNCTADAANDKITITKTGYYRVEGSFSFSSGTANVEWFGSLFAGGVEINSVHWTRKVGTAGDVGNAGFTGIIDITTANTDVDIRLRHDNAGSVDITVSYANLNVTYVGET